MSNVRWSVMAYDQCLMVILNTILCNTQVEYFDGKPTLTDENLSAWMRHLSDIRHLNKSQMSEIRRTKPS